MNMGLGLSGNWRKDGTKVDHHHLIHCRASHLYKDSYGCRVSKHQLKCKMILINKSVSLWFRYESERGVMTCTLFEDPWRTTVVQRYNKIAYFTLCMQQKVWPLCRSESHGMEPSQKITIHTKELTITQTYWHKDTCCLHLQILGAHTHLRNTTEVISRISGFYQLVLMVL